MKKILVITMIVFGSLGNGFSQTTSLAVKDTINTRLATGSYITAQSLRAALVGVVNFADASLLKKLETIATKSALIAFTATSKVSFDGSEWVKKTGVKASNGGAFAGTIVNVDGSNYWERDFDEYINVKWFGAKGDSNFNTGTGTDDSDAIQNAVNSKNNLFFPDGVYKVTRTIQLNADMTSLGSRFAPKLLGQNSISTIIFPVNVTGPVIDYRQGQIQIDNNAFGFGLSITNLGIKGADNNRAVCGSAISISGAWNPIFKNIKIRALTGFGLIFPFDTRTADIVINGNPAFKDGDKFSNGSATIQEVGVELCNKWGFYFDTSNSSILMSNSYASYCLGGGMYLLGGGSTVVNSSFSYCGNLTDVNSCGLQIGDDILNNKTGSLRYSYSQAYNNHFSNIELDSNFGRNLIACGYFHTFDKVRLIQGTIQNGNGPFFNAPILAQLGLPNSSLFSSTFTNTVIRAIGNDPSTQNPLITTAFSDAGSGSCFNIYFKNVLNIFDNPFNDSYNGLTNLGLTYYSFTNSNSYNIVSEAFDNKIVFSKTARNTDSDIPTIGRWNLGDVVFNRNPSFDKYAGWICTTSGTPGIWKGFGLDNSILVNASGSNTKVGEQSLFSNTAGYQNSAFGRRAGFSNTTGFFNSFYGAGAGYNNTQGNYNTYLGLDCGFSATTASYNAALGFESLINNVTGGDNTSIGIKSGRNVTTGNANTFLGANAGLGVITGNNNTLLGANITAASSALSNTIIISDGTGTPKIFVSSTGNAGFGTSTPTSKMQVVGLLTYADNATATAAGLTVGAFYRTSTGVLMVVF